MTYILKEPNHEYKPNCSINVPQTFCELNKSIDILTHNLVTNVMYETPHNSIYDAFFLANQYNVGLEFTPNFMKCVIIAGIIRHLEYKQNIDKYREFFVNFEGKRSVEIMSVNGVLDFKSLFCTLDLTPECSNFLDMFFVNELSPDNIYILLLKLLSNYFEYTVIVEEFMIEPITYTNNIIMKDNIIDYKNIISASHFNIKGEESDWVMLIMIVKNLNPIGLDWWGMRLQILFSQFKSVSINKVFEQFWKLNFELDVDNMFFAGWIKNFFPYIRKYGGVYFRNMFKKISTQSIPDMKFSFQYMIIETDLTYHMMQTNISFDTISYDINNTLIPNILWIIESKGKIENIALTTQIYGQEYECPDETEPIYCDKCKILIESNSYGYYSLNICKACCK